MAFKTRPRRRVRKEYRIAGEVFRVKKKERERVPRILFEVLPLLMKAIRAENPEERLELEKAVMWMLKKRGYDASLLVTDYYASLDISHKRSLYREYQLILDRNGNVEIDVLIW